jgi:hypothetical protein
MGRSPQSAGRVGLFALAVSLTDFRQVLGMRDFEQVSARPLCQSPPGFRVGFKRGQNDDPCSRKLS